jgi:hypothetical protein
VSVALLRQWSIQKYSRRDLRGVGVHAFNGKATSWLCNVVENSAARCLHCDLAAIDSGAERSATATWSAAKDPTLRSRAPRVDCSSARKARSASRCLARSGSGR